MKLFVLCCLLSPAIGDIYLHNPRGSNNRLDEQGRERNNANRTNQHSCGDENNNCELVVQYMCHENLRDGATTTTIPENLMDCENYDCDTDKRYGMHETYDHYLDCKHTHRNMGLFTADQNLKRDSARYTRQNPNGNRRGYECPEERDYYPYWGRSMWKDIVVMTKDATRCPHYQSESQNVKSRWVCQISRDVLYQNMNNHDLRLPVTQEECEAFEFPAGNPEAARGQWVEIPSHGLPAPDCMESQFSRDNHLGNGAGGYPLSYNWTIPNTPAENCAIRIRYNISTEDYAGWGEGAADSTNNKEQRRGRHANLNLAPLVGLGDETEAQERGYVFKNNPEVQIFEGVDLDFRLAINTAQLGRTFQDRSHRFAIRERPAELQGVVIHNVNVRGKRGNIVQVYPAVEYDFIPNTLDMKLEDYVHFQWTGSNTNPHNNDGQGLRGTDRSNVLLQRPAVYPEGTGAAYAAGQKYGHWGRSYPDMVRNSTLLGFSRDQLVKLALLEPHQFGGEMSELDDAGTYFDLGAQKVTMAGVYHYLCTRNNNFSNRSQKGRLVVRVNEAEQRSIGWNGGTIQLADGVTTVNVPQGAFSQLHNMRVEKWAKEDAMKGLMESDKRPPSENLAGHALVIHPEDRLTNEGETFEILMPYESNALDETVVYVTQTNTHTWTRVDAQKAGNTLRIQAERGGYYIATNQLKAGPVAGIVIGCLVAVGLIVLAVVCVVRKPPQALSRMMAKEV